MSVASTLIFDVIGLSGVALSTLCYARLQWQRDFAKKLSYSALNALASTLLLISLWNTWNIAAFTSNLIWIMISLYGVHRCIKYQLSAKKTDDNKAPETIGPE